MDIGFPIGVGKEKQGVNLFDNYHVLAEGFATAVKQAIEKVS